MDDVTAIPCLIFQRYHGWYWVRVVPQSSVRNTCSIIAHCGPKSIWLTGLISGGTTCNGMIPQHHHTIVQSYHHTIIPSYHNTIIPYNTIIPSYHNTQYCYCAWHPTMQHEMIFNVDHSKTLTFPERRKPRNCRGSPLGLAIVFVVYLCVGCKPGNQSSVMRIPGTIPKYNDHLRVNILRQSGTVQDTYSRYIIGKRAIRRAGWDLPKNKMFGRHYYAEVSGEHTRSRVRNPAWTSFPVSHYNNKGRPVLYYS